MSIQTQGTSSLPVRGGLRSAYTASLAIAALTALVSAAGLLFPSAVYPTEEFRNAFVPNDVVNLAVGLPILLGSLWLAARGRPAGLLLWPGALLYTLYNFLVYFLCMPLNAAFVAYLALVTAGGYTLIRLVSSIDGKAVQDRLAGAVPERLCGGVLAGLGGLFFLRTIGVLAEAIGSGTPLAPPELTLNVSDFVISPAWIIGGLQLWRRRPLGYVGGLGLLFSLAMLFIGLIFIFLLEPFLTASAFRWVDTIVILGMGMVVFAPLGLFLRGVIAGRKDDREMSS
jgi:hypothetical protein